MTAADAVEASEEPSQGHMRVLYRFVRVNIHAYRGGGVIWPRKRTFLGKIFTTSGRCFGQQQRVEANEWSIDYSVDTPIDQPIEETGAVFKLLKFNGDLGIFNRDVFMIRMAS